MIPVVKMSNGQIYIYIAHSWKFLTHNTQDTGNYNAWEKRIMKFQGPEHILEFPV